VEFQRSRFSLSLCFGGLNGTVFEPVCGGVGGVLVLIGSKKSLREGGGNGVSIFRKYSKTDIKKKCILAAKQTCEIKLVEKGTLRIALENARSLPCMKGFFLNITVYEIRRYIYTLSGLCIWQFFR
jgi:hypothetical protein